MKSISDQIFKIRSTALASRFLLLTLFSCAHVSLQPIEDPAQLVQQVHALSPKIHTLNTQASVIAITKEKTYRFKIGLLMDEKNAFIETYGFGVPQGYLSLFDQQLKVVIPAQRELYLGSNKSSLQPFLNLNISIQDLFAPILHQIVPHLDVEVHLDDSKKKYILQERGGDKFWVDSKFHIRRIELHNALVQNIEYGENISSQIQFPERIKIFSNGESIELHFDQVAINEEISTKLFQIDVPTSDFHVYSIDSH